MHSEDGLAAFDALHERAVLEQIERRPLYAYEVARATGLAEGQVRDAMERCLASGYAVIPKKHAPPVLTEAGRRELDRRLRAA